MFNQHTDAYANNQSSSEECVSEQTFTPNNDLEPLKITAVGSSYTISIKEEYDTEKVESPTPYFEVSFEYSVDGGSTWQTYNFNQSTKFGDDITIEENQSVLFRGNNPNGLIQKSDKPYENFCNFQTSTSGIDSSSVKVEGNIMSLLGTETLPKAAFYRFFSDANYLSSAPSLPSLELADSCYERMFESCCSLQQIPNLPAKNLKPCCYKEMFRYCYDLQSVQLPQWDTVAEESCNAMFYRCEALQSTTDLGDYQLHEGCFYQMYAKTSLIKALNLPSVEIAIDCYCRMFWGCDSLNEPPELPATSLKYNCYGYMFSDCTSLESAPVLPATELDNACYGAMFSGCSNLTQTPSLPAQNLAEDCYRKMFSGCKALSRAPYLPAKELKSGCYTQMFNKCTKLNYVEVEFEYWLPASENKITDATGNWLNGVAETGEFICSSKLTVETGPSRIPENWVNKKFIDINFENTQLTYNASAQFPDIQVAGPSSYAIKYSLDGQVYTESKPDIIDAGNYVLYCKAETSETGYLSPTIRSAEIVVDPLTVQDDKLIVGKIEAQTFTGDEIRPNLDVKYVIDEPEFSLLRFFKFENGIQELEQDKDYTVSYKNNVEPGTASVNINFIGNYAGETTSNFEIVSSPESKNVASTAQTGDASNIGLIVMVIAIAGAFCALSRKKLWNK